MTGGCQAALYDQANVCSRGGQGLIDPSGGGRTGRFREIVAGKRTFVQAAGQGSNACGWWQADLNGIGLLGLKRHATV